MIFEADVPDVRTSAPQNANLFFSRLHARTMMIESGRRRGGRQRERKYFPRLVFLTSEHQLPKAQTFSSAGMGAAGEGEEKIFWF